MRKSSILAVICLLTFLSSNCASEEPEAAEGADTQQPSSEDGLGELGAAGPGAATAAGANTGVLVDDNSAVLGPTGDPAAVSLLKSMTSKLAGRSARRVDVLEISLFGLEWPLPQANYEYDADGSYSIKYTAHPVAPGTEQDNSWFSPVAVETAGITDGMEVISVDSTLYMKVTSEYVELLGIDVDHGALSEGYAWFTISPKLAGEITGDYDLACKMETDGSVVATLVNTGTIVQALGDTRHLLNTGTSDSDCDGLSQSLMLGGLLDHATDVKFNGQEQVRGVEMTRVSFKVQENYLSDMIVDDSESEEDYSGLLTGSIDMDLLFNSDGLLMRMVMDFKLEFGDMLAGLFEDFADQAEDLGDQPEDQSLQFFVRQTTDLFDFDEDITVAAPPDELIAGNLDISDFPIGYFDADQMSDDFELEYDTDQLFDDFKQHFDDVDNTPSETPTSIPASAYEREALCTAAGYQWLSPSGICVDTETGSR